MFVQQIIISGLNPKMNCHIVQIIFIQFKGDNSSNQQTNKRKAIIIVSDKYLFVVEACRVNVSSELVIVMTVP